MNEERSKQRCYTHTFVTVDVCGCPPDQQAEVPDSPEAPTWLSSEAAYGWSCGWTAGYKAALAARSDGEVS